MPKNPKPTPENPRGLNAQELLTIEYAVNMAKKTGKLDIGKALINVKGLKKDSAKTEKYKKLKNRDFRAELVEQLTNADILGANGKVGQVLMQGLKAQKVVTNKDGEIVDQLEDHQTRLKYAQEINKISGVYAPEKRETKRMTMNIDMSAEELEESMRALQGELTSIHSSG